MALHPLRSAAPLTWRCTRSERVQCLRIGCTAHTNKPNREYAHLHMGRHCTTGRVRTLLRVCLCGCGPGRLSLLGLALCRRDQRRARPRCRWAAAGPGRASRRRAEPIISTPGSTGVEGAGGTGGPGCGTRGRRQGLAAVPVGGGRARLRHPWAAAGPGRASRRRAERSSQRGRLAGGPPPTGASSSPARQHTTRRPEHPWGSKQRRRSVGATNNTKPPGPTGDRATHASGR